MTYIKEMIATGYHVEWTGYGELEVRGIAGGAAQVIARAAYDGAAYGVTTAWGTFHAPNVATVLLDVATMEAAARAEAGPYKRVKYLA